MANETETNSVETETQSSTATPTTEVATGETTTTTETTETEKIDLGKDSGSETETKTTETKTEETDARYGAPEGDAEYELALPEGIELDKDALAMVAPELKELNLSNDAASKLVSTFAEKVLPHYEELFTKNLEASIVAQKTTWEGAARDLISGKGEDGAPLVAKNKLGEELSFDGKNMGEVQKVAARALDRIAPAGFREFLEQTGMGVHPQFIVAMYQAGKLLAEDGDFETSTATATPKSRETLYYGEPKS